MEDPGETSVQRRGEESGRTSVDAEEAHDIVLLPPDKVGSREMSRQRLIYVRTALRWLLVLPVALGGAILAMFPVHWALQAATLDGSIIQISRETAAAIERGVQPLIMSFGFVYAGARCAPARRIAVALALSVLLILSLQIILIYSWRAGSVSSLRPSLVVRALVLQVVGAVMATCAIAFKPPRSE